jgi:hypothetical protein
VAAQHSRVVAVALGGALAVEATLLAVLLGYDDLTHYRQAQLLAALSAPVWVLAVFLLWRLRPARAGLLVLGVCAVLQLIAVTHGPSTSDDDYRYAWDAKVQLAGVDPYRYPPAAPQLAHLREPFLFGPPDHCAYHFAGGCTSINRPTVRTVYPPVAEAAFDVMRAASFGGRGGHLPLQLFGALGSLLIAWLLLRRAPPWLAAVWAWCPVVAIEYANNAHIDWLATLLVVLALSSRRVWSAGALLGAAIAVKIYPVLVLPSLMRRSWLAAPAAFALVVLVYVPHVIAVGTDVIGYLPGYLHEEKYGSGGRLVLLGAVLPHPVDTVVGVLILVAVGLWAWLRGPADAPQRSAVVVVGVALLVFTPNYGWYAGVLLALVAMTGALEWVPVVFAPTFAYLIHSDHDTLIYAIAALLTAAVALVRHADSLRSWHRSISPGTGRSRSSASPPRR